MCVGERENRGERERNEFLKGGGKVGGERRWEEWRRMEKKEKKRKEKEKEK